MAYLFLRQTLREVSYELVLICCYCYEACFRKLKCLHFMGVKIDHRSGVVPPSNYMSTRLELVHRVQYYLEDKINSAIPK